MSLIQTHRQLDGASLINGTAPLEVKSLAVDDGVLSLGNGCRIRGSIVPTSNTFELGSPTNTYLRTYTDTLSTGFVNCIGSVTGRSVYTSEQTTIGTTLSVAGLTTLSGAARVTGSLSVSGTVRAGLLTATSLSCTGGLSVSGILHTNASLTCSTGSNIGTVSQPFIAVHSGLVVCDTVKASVLSTAGLLATAFQLSTAGSIRAGTSLTCSTTLSCAGHATLRQNCSVGGTLDAGNVVTGGLVSCGSTLNVVGGTTLRSGCSVTGTLAVTSNATTGNLINNGYLSSSGAATLGSVKTTGTISCGAAINASSVVSVGVLSCGGAVVVAGSGGLSVGGQTRTGSLVVSGYTSLGDLGCGIVNCADLTTSASITCGLDIVPNRNLLNYLGYTGYFWHSVYTKNLIMDTGGVFTHNGNAVSLQKAPIQLARPTRSGNNMETYFSLTGAPNKYKVSISLVDEPSIFPSTHSQNIGGFFARLYGGITFAQVSWVGIGYVSVCIHDIETGLVTHAYEGFG